VFSLKFMACALMAVVATAVALSAPAAADETAYLQRLQARYVFLSADQLLSAGAKVCSATRSGHTSADAVTMVRNDLGVSISAAGDIVSTAIVDLDC
jgi:hypothetical protein